MSLSCKQNTALADFFARSGPNIAADLARIAMVVPHCRAAYESAEKTGELAAYIEAEFQIFPLYLEKAFRTGNVRWLSLYVGEKLKQSHGDGSGAVGKDAVARILKEDGSYLADAVSAAGLKNEAGELAKVLNSLTPIVIAEAARELRVLWIADCLYLDILSFLAEPLASASISLRPDFITTKNPIERFEKTSALLEANTYDAIFYCPFSYENSITYSRLLNPRQAAQNLLSARQLASAEFATLEAQVRLLSEKAECPVFVHNASGVMRHLGGWKEWVKDAATRPARMAYCRDVNARLAQLVRELNATRPVGQTVIIDEFTTVQQNGVKSSGSYFLHHGYQHPAMLGLYMVDTYLDALTAVDRLLKKKVVVCDLDYTLWDGMIGEGAVTHYVDRQAILKSLKNKGVLLAVNSKNDPANVKWSEAGLGAGDFAASRINWNTKVENIAELAEEMNLNTSSFVFVDDRADERAMVSSIYPQTVTLDAEDEATWRRLALWERMLSGVGVIDRTEMYKKRQEREKFISASPQLSKARLFEELGLRCSVALADPKSLPRVAELLNRTNQFNTTGRRTSLKEVQSWHESSDWSIYVARAGDRFGDMGLVSVLVAHRTGDRVTIEAFVLSCRVFGYGVETAILKALTEANRDATISGAIVPTSVNQPCQTVYEDHGFRREGDRWVFDGAAPAIANKGWLSVDNQVRGQREPAELPA